MPVPPATARRTARLGALDVLRFGAAFGVVAFHFTGISPAWDGRAPGDVDAVGRWAAYGAMGVPLFFVISGFVVLMTAWGRDIPHFVASRIGRLFPAYWAAVVIAAVFAFAVWPASAVVEGRAPTKADALLNLTMLQGAFDGQDLDGVFWTLWTEARFYALIAVFVLVGITRRRVLAFATLWPIAGAMAATSDSALLSTLLIADYAPYFAGGMLLYVVHRYGHDLLTWLLIGVQSLIALRFALGEYSVSLPRATGWPVSTTLIALVSFSCFGLVALVTLTRLNRRSARWMTLLGALTYPLYLVHQKIGLFTIHVLGSEVSPWLALAAGLVAALVAAIALHHLVEKPWGGRLRAAVLRSLQAATRETATSSPAPRPGPAALPAAAPDVPSRVHLDLRVPTPAGARD